MEFRVRRATAFRGEFTPPADKSLTHRAYMLAAMATQFSHIENPLAGEDCEATKRCLAQLGTHFSIHGHTVHVAPASFATPNEALDCGNSGTTMRLLSGIIAGHPITVKLTGDASLSKRPMRRVLEPLALMGAKTEGEYPPISVTGSNSLRGIDYLSPTGSAQVKSALLFAGLRASGTTRVRAAHPSRDHTERMLQALGAKVSISADGVAIQASNIPGFSFQVPGDISSAAFFLVAAACVPGAEIVCHDLGLNPTRDGVWTVFKQCGVAYQRSLVREELTEPVGTATVKGNESLKAFEISGELVPQLIDEIPVLAVLATQCHGVSTIRDARELRVKESDRIEVMAAGLRAMGAKVEACNDGMDIEGPTPLHGATIEANHDHRIAMAFAVAGLLADQETVIHGAETVATSYPNFMEELNALATF